MTRPRVSRALAGSLLALAAPVAHAEPARTRGSIGVSVGPGPWIDDQFYSGKGPALRAAFGLRHGLVGAELAVGFARLDHSYFTSPALRTFSPSLTFHLPRRGRVDTSVRASLVVGRRTAEDPVPLPVPGGGTHHERVSQTTLGFGLGVTPHLRLTAPGRREWGLLIDVDASWLWFRDDDDGFAPYVKRHVTATVGAYVGL